MATSAQKDALVALYAGYFDRAPDPAGLQFWLNQIDNGRAFNTIAADFAASSEATTLYPFLTAPDVASSSTFITSVYQNLFNRAPDAAGLKFWSDVLAAKSVSVGDMIEAIINGAKDAPTATPPTFDKATLNNKVEAGLDFAVDAGNTTGFTFNAADKVAATEAIAGVTNDPATVTAAKAQTDAYLTGSVTAGQTIKLTTSTVTPDAIQGTDKADTIDASIINSLQNADVIDGKGGVDTLNATLAGNAANAPVIVGVENINLTSIGSVTGLDATNWGDAKIGVSGTAGNTTTIANLADGASLSMNSVKHSVTVDPLANTAKNALSVTLNAGGDHGTLTVHAGTDDYDALTLKSAGTADNTVTIGSAMNEGTGTTADPRETVMVEGTAGLTIKGSAANLTGASIDATALVAGKNAVVNVVDSTATSFSAARLTAVDSLQFSAATGSTTVAMADVNGLADKQVVQLNNNATAGLKLSSGSATTTAAATLMLADADIAGAITTDATFDVENLTVNSGGAANSIGSIALSADSGSSLNVTGDKDLTVGAISGPADKGVVDASALTGKFVMTAASSAGVETVKGGAGNDTLLVTTNASARSTVVDAGAGNDTITVTGNAGQTATIVVGAGDNTVNLSVAKETVDLAGGGKDTVNFADSSATADADIITGFQTGSDKLSFDADANISAITGTAVDASGPAVAVADDKVVVVTGGANLTSGSTVDAALAAALTAELTFAANAESVVVYNDGASGNAFAYLINDADGNSVIAATEITLLGTIAGTTVAAGDIA